MSLFYDRDTEWLNDLREKALATKYSEQEEVRGRGYADVNVLRNYKNPMNSRTRETATMPIIREKLF
jgi:hypothetical protein